MLETSYLARKYTDKCNLGKYNFYYHGPFNFADATIFFRKNQCFLAEIVPLLKAVV